MKRTALFVGSLVSFLIAGVSRTSALQASTGQVSDSASVLRQYVSNQYRPLGDYVPCMFDDDEAKVMRTRDASTSKSNLDSAGADAFVKLVQAQILTSFGIQGAAVDGKLPPKKLDTKAQALSDSLKDPGGYQNLTIDAAFANLAAAVKSNGMTDAQALTLISNLKAQIGGGGIQRPDDVSCSFSILPWRETNEVFGRMVANDYIAVEVNIRNLNKQNEFLVHDIQVAVDTGLDADSFGRFEAARDKLIVRGVAQRGESDDVRNRTMNILSTVGALAGGASGALTQTVQAVSSSDANWLSTSVAVFQGPLLSGLNKIWPDHTIDNVNNVSDLAFSASSTTKTVVPVQGSVPLVTFLAEKPLEQLPFARCGKNTKTPVNPGDQCSIKVLNAADGKPFGKALDFHSWPPAALNILKHRIFVVVAGVHIQEVAPNAAADSVVCPEATDGTVDLSKQDKSGDVSCTVSGTNLGSAKSAKLEQGTATSLSATITPAADGNSAILSFKAADFTGKTGTFEIFSVDSSGKETDLDRSLKFALPVTVGSLTVDSVAYSQATLNPAADLTVKISGTNLNQMSDISLIDKGAKVSIPGKVTDPADAATVTGSTKSITVTFAKADLAKFTDKTDGPATIQYDTLADTKTKATAPADKGLPLQ